MNLFKPQLLPNDKAGETIDWEARIGNPQNWLLSHKYDGARVELFEDGIVKGRSLKTLPSLHINRMAEDLTLLTQHTGVIEAEFFSHDMNFAELMHFFKTENVTSEHTVAKYTKLWEKTQGDPAKGWKYPGRTVEWLTTWHPSLKFYVFDHVFTNGDDRTKYKRYEDLQHMFKRQQVSNDEATLIYQFKPSHIDEITLAYDSSIRNGGEGLVLMRQDSLYKTGRLTLNSAQGFKIKDSNKEYEGVILSVEEGTEAREGAEKTINELGRSKTSQLKEDRIPSGMAKGFKVKMDDGNELTVALNGFDHKDRKTLMQNHGNFLIGERIKFTGMAPVKHGGCPRHAHYTKGNLR